MATAEENTAADFLRPTPYDDGNQHRSLHNSDSYSHPPLEDEPEIDVLIVTYNNEETLALLARSLACQKHVKLSLFCVDNSPGEGTCTLLKKLWPKSWIYHDVTNPGFGYSVNRAAKAGRGKWIFIINPDAYMLKDNDIYYLYCQALTLQQQMRTEQVILGPQLISSDGSVYPSGRAFPSIITGSVHAISTLFRYKGAKKYLHPQSSSILPHMTQVDWVSGSAMFMPRQTFDILNGFDDKYRMYAEDIDLCWRLQQRGGKVGKIDDCMVVHIGGVSSGGGTVTTLWWHHMSMIKFLLTTTRSFHRLALVMVIPGLLLRFLIAVLMLKSKR